MINYIWAVVIAALLLDFLIVGVYKLGSKRGYRRGATDVLNEWKKYMIALEDEENDNNR